MALERFMLYPEQASGGQFQVVYCWGFRAALTAARKMAGWSGSAWVVTVDLDTLAETRWSGDRRDYQPQSEDPPVAGFIMRRPESLVGPAPGSHLLGETDLRGGLTVWVPLGEYLSR